VSLVWFLVGLAIGAAAGAWLYRSTYNKALRDDRNYQEQSYWVAQDACERAWRHLRTPPPRLPRLLPRSTHHRTTRACPMTALCAACGLPLGGDWPHHPHQPGCPGPPVVDCDCPTDPVHAGCCPCTEKAA